MYTKYYLSALFIIGLFIFPSIIYAADTCLPVFNGGKGCTTSKNLSVTKQVKNPQTNQYVSSLSSQGPFFSPSQTIQFRVTIQNTSKSTIKDIRVVDTFPSYVIYQSGTGKFDSSKHTLTTTIDELQINGMHSYEITAKIASLSDLQKLSGNMNCFINQISATSRGNSVQTNTQYCIDKAQKTPAVSPTQNPQPTEFINALPITPTPIINQNTGKIVYAPATPQQTPKTGAETLSLLVLIPSALAGWYIKRKTA